MTNFQGGATGPVSREQVLFWVPVVVASLLSVGLAALFVWPKWQSLQQAEQELQQLDEQRQRIPLLRAQLQKLDADRAQAELRSRQILGLVAGSGDIQTFMAQLSEEAQRTGVQLESYEPMVERPKEETDQKKSANAQQKKAPAPPPDPLLAPGLQKTALFVVAQGNGPQLLAFLRGLERLSLLVVQSDLQVTVAPKPEPNQPFVRPSLKINLSLYAKDGQAPSSAAAVSAKPEKN
jgi:type IV pilus assembly protein PilO